MKKLSFLLVLVGCVDGPELAVEADELTAPTVAIHRGACTTKDVSPDNFLRFDAALRTDLLPRMRTVANSPAFRQCLFEAITIGGKRLGSNRWQNQPNGVVAEFGPYIPRNAEVVDLGFNATRDLPLERMRAMFVDRIVLEATSPHQVDITCMKDQGGGVATGLTDDRAAAENFFLSEDFFNENPALTGTITSRGFRSFTAAVIWHEVMHERGYHHSNKEGRQEPQYNNRIPAIVGACMDEAFYQAEQMCGLTACRGGFVASYGFPAADGGSCGCIRDPGASFIPTLVGSWSWPGLTKFDVDDGGRSYVLAGGVAYRLDYDGWTQLGTALDLVAGGDAVGIKHPSPLIVGAPYWWTIMPVVGPQASTPSVAGEVMTMDSFGRLIRQLGGQVERKQGNMPWVPHGSADSVAAGADLIYKISNGVASRLDDGATPTWTSIGPLDGTMSVDVYGTLYNLRPDQTLWRHRGTYWEHIGGPDDQLDTGASFFTHSPVDGFVYRRAPDNGWYRVAQCDSFAAGGRSVLCRRGTTLERYEY